MRHRATLAGALLGVVLGAAAARAARPDQPIPLDPQLVQGELDNGLRYFIRENGKPEKRAELRLVVRAGSVDEDEDQRGLAHFVEHMLFNGTKSYAGTEIIDYLESVGARFGADLNAYTSFDETVYMLQIPTDREGLLHEGINILSEFAHLATFSGEEIEKERGVVLAEWRNGLGAGQRVRDRQLPILLKDSRYAARLPIGDPEILKSGDPDALRRFYRERYRPERMAVIAVGDVKPDEVERWIRELFAGIPPTAELRELADRAVPVVADTLFALADDAELRGTSIGYSRKVPAEDDEATFGGYRRSLVRQAAFRIFNERLSEIARSADPPFLAAGFGADRFGRTDVPGLSARVVDGGEARGLEALLVEERRAALHGFGEAELDRLRRNMLAEIEAAWAEREKTESSAYAAEYARHFIEAEPVPGIDMEREIWQRELPGITAKECHEAFLEFANAGGLVISGSRPTSAPAVDETAMRTLMREVAARDVTPYVDAGADGRLITEPRPAGKVVERREIPEIGVTELTLSNGCRVVLKPTTFQDDAILFDGSAPGGASRAEDADLASAEAAVGIVGESGVGGHSAVALDKLLAGKVASASPYFQDRHHGVSGSATRADLETALELAVLAMTSPNRDEAAFRRFLDRLRARLVNRDADPAIRYFDRLTAINHRDHPRTRPLTLDRLGEIDLDRALAFYRESFADASNFTFHFAGNIDVAATIPMLERTIGSLPGGGGKRSKWVDREVLFAEKSVRETVRAGHEPRATTTLTFASYDGSDPFEWHRIRTVCSILERRLLEKLREERGATYGVGVGFTHSLVGPARGRTTVRFGSEPALADTLVSDVLRAVRELAAEGPTEADVAKEKELQLRELETAMEQNAFWVSSFSGLWLRERPLVEVLDRKSRIEALNAAELKRAAAEAFDLERFTWVDWLPKDGAAPAAPPAGATKPGSPGDAGGS